MTQDTTPQTEDQNTDDQEAPIVDVEQLNQDLPEDYAEKKAAEEQEHEAENA